MKIENHLLVSESGETNYRASPNQSGSITPQYIVMHYTAGRSLDGTVAYLRRPRARASAHVVIGRSGEIVQLVPFDKKAWHAGKSSWRGKSGLNGRSIGIELDNAGVLKKIGGQWKTWFGATIRPEEVLEERHRFGGPTRGWHTYTEAQLEAASDLCDALLEQYPSIVELLGHEDIAPRRKTDPGPAFPLDGFRQRLFGREDDGPEDDADDTRHEIVARTKTVLNIRAGAGAKFDKIVPKGLPQDTKVAILGRDGPWVHVDVLADIDGDADLQGWVHGRYLETVG